MTMKKKYKLRCINNAPFSSDQMTQNLTIGKIYETYDNPNLYNGLLVINDFGDEVHYSASRFVVVTIAQLRDEKLKELGI